MSERRTARLAAGADDDAVNRLASDFAAVGHQEAAALRDDALTALSGVAGGATLLVAGGVSAVLAVSMASTAALRALETRLSPRWAAAVMAVGYLGVAAGTTAAAVRELRAAGGGAQRMTDQVANELSVLGRRISSQVRRAYRPGAAR
ncbi:phage holin family protein [Rugosimonospora africana]|uniref:Holin-X, holin superfamily III n=1 Tax=Rugosimonospora africana TaxID=556532 RepID=A0A8J3VQ55_9ACTN|nr:phage holin family protein [Rugosimonospora africana]GIH14008.1 hypothetical protein Raf01_21800 [Rugosimonospora africana]